MNKLFILLLSSLLIFFLQCSPTSSVDPTVIKIQDIWFSDMVDNDADSYYSDANLYFELSVNKASIDVFVVLGVRVSDPEDIAQYVPCFTSVSLEVLKDSDNTWYIPINNLDLELTHGNYDFCLQVFLDENPDKIAAEALPSSDLDLYKVSFESPEEDSAIKTTWLSYHNGTFETGEYGFRGRVFVRFDKPTEAVTCVIKEIKIYIYKSEDPANTSFRLSVVTDSTIYSNSFSNNSVGWKNISVNLNIAETDTFYVECILSQGLDPSPTKITIGLDTETQDVDRSYTIYPAPVLMSPLNGELGIEVLIEYTGGIEKAGKKPQVND